MSWLSSYHIEKLLWNKKGNVVTPAVHSQLTGIHTLKPAVLDHVWIPASWECTAGVMGPTLHSPFYFREVFLILLVRIRIRSAFWLPEFSPAYLLLWLQRGCLTMSVDCLECSRLDALANSSQAKSRLTCTCVLKFTGLTTFLMAIM